MSARAIWNGVLNKIGRIRRAFARGFWAAWLEVPPASARRGSGLTITVNCDTTDFDRKMREVLRTITYAEQRAQRFSS